MCNDNLCPRAESATDDWLGTTANLLSKYEQEAATTRKII